MTYQMAMTKNLRRFLNAVGELMDRPEGTEGMGLLWGEPGEGKSTAVAYVVSVMDGVFVRAVGCWTVTSMLGELCKELGGHRMLRRSDMIDYITQKLADNPRPIFIDEADYLFRQFEMMDALRDIYDVSGCPVILIGMEDIARKLQAHGRFARRITQWVEFKGVDLDDARVLGETVCKVKVEKDLLAYLHQASRANVGRMVIGFSKIERMAKASGLTSVSLEQWGERELFYDQPVFASRRGANGNGNGGKS
ncbi:MAG: ATP-binding protein [Desulfuromonadales bacterium]|nr:ATP-binding protein [Desulfuromonadales bacterium]MDW7758710.1 ATP-binding protein [Desulfuromonadales bacterium]